MTSSVSISKKDKGSGSPLYRCKKEKKSTYFLQKKKINKEEEKNIEERESTPEDCAPAYSLGLLPSFFTSLYDKQEQLKSLMAYFIGNHKWWQQILVEFWSPVIGYHRMCFIAMLCLYVVMVEQ